MSSIDEVSQKLGSFETAIKSMGKNVEKILEVQKQNGEALVRQEIKIENNTTRLDTVEPIIQGHEAIKNKARGAIIISGGLGGGAAIMLVTAWEWIIKTMFS